MPRQYTSQHTARKLWPILIGLVALTLLLSACGGAQPKVYHVGILSGVDFFGDTADGFKAKMTELGYVEGKNIVYDFQKTNVEPPTEQRILKKFVDDKVDLIFTFPTEVSQEAKAATQGTNIPVLFANADIEGMNLVDSVPNPGGNITGVRFPGPQLAAKGLEVLHEIAPQAKRVWLPYQKGYPIVPGELDVLRPTAVALGVTLVDAPASSVADFQASLQALDQASSLSIDAILTIPDPLAGQADVIAALTKFGVEHKLPVGGTGGPDLIVNLSTDHVATGKQAAQLADKIFKGIPAGTIPVPTADMFMQINYKATQQLGITVPEGLLAQANQIIR